jgi:hypothetical protein
VKAKDKSAADPMASVTMPEMPRGGYDLINRSVSKRKFSHGGKRFEIFQYWRLNILNIVDDTDAIFDEPGSVGFFFG